MVDLSRERDFNLEEISILNIYLEEEYGTFYWAIVNFLDPKEIWFKTLYLEEELEEAKFQIGVYEDQFGVNPERVVLYVMKLDEYLRHKLNRNDSNIWISVKERYPVDGQMVLVCVPSFECKNIVTCARYQYDWDSNTKTWYSIPYYKEGQTSSNQLNKQPICWAYLPESPSNFFLEELK